MKQGSKLVNILIGRFQPFHLSHYLVVKQLYEQNSLPIVIVSVRGKGNYGKGTSISQSLSNKMMDVLVNDCPFIIDHVEISHVAFDSQLFPSLRPKYEPVLLGAGADRFDGYTRQTKTSKEKGSLNIHEDFEVIKTKRNFNIDKKFEISGTDIRRYIKEGDKNSFIESMPQELYVFWDALFNEMKHLKESYKIDSFAEFLNNKL